MTTSEFQNKYDQSEDEMNNHDVLLRIQSNLSDLHIEKDFFTPEQMDAKLNSIKTFISDWKSVIRNQDNNIKNHYKH
jgi:hypothetical protein